MKVGRNAPCPCGSGKKFKLCCLGRNPESVRKIKSDLQDDFIDGPIDDYGTPVVDDFFFEGRFIDYSVANIIYNELKHPEISMLAEEIVEMTIDRGNDEKLEIERMTDARDLVEMMKRKPDVLNHRLLLNKIISQKEITIPMMIDELRSVYEDIYVELAAKAIYKSKMDCSSQLLDLIHLPIRNAYSLSTICLVTGMIGSETAFKPLWDCYHFFDKRYPQSTYSQGPLIGLYELKEKHKCKTNS